MRSGLVSPALPGTGFLQYACEAIWQHDQGVSFLKCSGGIIMREPRSMCSLGSSLVAKVSGHEASGTGRSSLLFSEGAMRRP